jgi:iron complex transport system ATP-binding protein
VTAPQPAPRGARVEVVGLSAAYGRTRVLDSVRFTVEPGGWLAVIGPNGSGKSTLLRSVLGLQDHEGQVRIDGVPATGMPRRDRARLLAYAPQLPVLPEGISTLEYVTLGRTPHRPLLAAPRRHDREVVADVLQRLDLEPLAGRLLVTLSGGEQQRAVLARALAQRPRVLFLDEPTAALDLGHAQQVLDLLDRLRREDGLTVVSTLHDLTLAGQYADRLTLLAGGRVVAEGTPAEVLTPAALAEHYGARAQVVTGPDGLAVLPVR